MFGFVTADFWYSSACSLQDRRKRMETLPLEPETIGVMAGLEIMCGLSGSDPDKVANMLLRITARRFIQVAVDGENPEAFINDLAAGSL